MIPDLRISIKDHRRGKNLKILLYRVPFGPRQFWVRMNGSKWPADGNPVSVTKLMTSLRKSLVKSAEPPWEVPGRQPQYRLTDRATSAALDACGLMRRER